MIAQNNDDNNDNENNDNNNYNDDVSNENNLCGWLVDVPSTQ